LFTGLLWVYSVISILVLWLFITVSAVENIQTLIAYGLADEQLFDIMPFLFDSHSSNLWINCCIIVAVAMWLLFKNTDNIKLCKATPQIQQYYFKKEKERKMQKIDDGEEYDVYYENNNINWFKIFKLIREKIAELFVGDSQPYSDRMKIAVWFSAISLIFTVSACLVENNRLIIAIVFILFLTVLPNLFWIFYDLILFIKKQQKWAWKSLKKAITLILIYCIIAFILALFSTKENHKQYETLAQTQIINIENTVSKKLPAKSASSNTKTPAKTISSPTQKTNNTSTTTQQKKETPPDNTAYADYLRRANAAFKKGIKTGNNANFDEAYKLYLKSDKNAGRKKFEARARMFLSEGFDDEYQFYMKYANKLK
jgi:hypothetical protein